MPGKVNPVIAEAVAQAAVMVLSLDQALSIGCSQGNLELNQMMPLIADCLLTEVTLLRNACNLFRNRCIEGIEADASRCQSQIENSTAAATALVETIGYENAVGLVGDARGRGKSIRQAAIDGGHVTAEQFDAAVSPEAVTRLGTP
jgi:aspartate ammonia-lyase